jgi:hypothetical protein
VKSIALIAVAALLLVDIFGSPSSVGGPMTDLGDRRMDGAADRPSVPPDGGALTAPPLPHPVTA